MFERTADDTAFIYADPLITEWQKREFWCGAFGQTASGYGKKLKTEWIVRIENRWHRVYCVCYSNVGTCYVIRKGKRYIVRESFPVAGKVSS
jgi:hypothetical protein